MILRSATLSTGLALPTSAERRTEEERERERKREREREGGREEGREGDTVTER
jgi:hypothetical protein